MQVSHVRRFASLAVLSVTLALGVAGCGPTAQPEEAAQALQTAQTLEQKGDDKAALAAYQKAAQLDARGKNAPLAYLKWGELAMETGQPDIAVTAYETLANYPTPVTVTTPGGSVVAVPKEAQPLLDRAVEELHRLRTSQPITGANIWTVLPYKAMDFLVVMTGKHSAFSYWLAILIFTGALKLLLTPLTVNQLRSSRKMMLIQPRLKEIQDKFRDKPEELNRRMIALYKEEGVNPLGCGSGMLLQMAIMFMLYRVILDYKFQFAKGHFLWVGSGLSEQFPSIIGANLAKPDMPLLIIYAISMVVQSRLTMVPTLDPQQAQQQKMMMYMMPLMLLVVLQTFPSAFTLYWLLFNVLSTIQQLHINKQLDVEMAARRTDEGGGGSPVIIDAAPVNPAAPANPTKKGSSGGGKKSNRRR